MLLRNFNVKKLTQNKSLLMLILSAKNIFLHSPIHLTILNKQLIKGAHREDCLPKFPSVFPADLVAAFAASPSVGSASF